MMTAASVTSRFLRCRMVPGIDGFVRVALPAQRLKIVRVMVGLRSIFVMSVETLCRSTADTLIAVSLFYQAAMQPTKARGIFAAFPLPLKVWVQLTGNRASDHISPRLIRSPLQASLSSLLPPFGSPRLSNLGRHLRASAGTAPTVGFAFQCCAQLLAMGGCAFV